MEIGISGTADSDTGRLITAVDTFIRGHFTIDKSIVRSLEDAASLPNRTPSVTDKDGTKDQSPVNLNRSGAVFNLYFQRGEAKNPETDPYWDDIIPQIDEEIHRIPKDIIVKGGIIAIALVFVIIFMIYMLS